jgi:hypothetical protein
MRLNRAAAGVTAVIMLTGLAGCGGDDGPSNGTEPTTPTESTSETTEPTPTEATSTPATPSDKALAQLEGYLELRDETLRRAKINFKQLAKYATGTEYLNIQQRVFAINQSGGSESGDYIHTLGTPRDLGSRIVIQDCEDSTQVVRLNRDGERVPDPIGPDGEAVPNPLPIDYTLVKEKGRWLVTKQNGLLEQTC